MKPELPFRMANYGDMVNDRPSSLPILIVLLVIVAFFIYVKYKDKFSWLYN